jgi:hypothetical protein
MIKKLFIIALVIWGLFVFYKKFMAPTLEPFFKTHKGDKHRESARVVG